MNNNNKENENFNAWMCILINAVNCVFNSGFLIKVLRITYISSFYLESSFHKTIIQKNVRIFFWKKEWNPWIVVSHFKSNLLLLRIHPWRCMSVGIILQKWRVKGLRRLTRLIEVIYFPLYVFVLLLLVMLACDEYEDTSDERPKAFSVMFNL